MHLIRSLKYVPCREFTNVARDLKPIYTAIDSEHARHELEQFDQNWGARFPVITQARADSCEHVTPFLAFPPEVRRFIYTTTRSKRSTVSCAKRSRPRAIFRLRLRARKPLHPRDPRRRPGLDENSQLATALPAFKIQFGDRLPD